MEICYARTEPEQRHAGGCVRHRLLKTKSSSGGKAMHYRNGREAKNGDQVVQLEGGKVVAVGVLYGATPGNDYCNGQIAPTQPTGICACICDCLHVDDVADVLASKRLDERPAGM